jgi:hypothetical protein
MVPTTGRDLSRIRGGMAAVIAVRQLGIRRRAALADRLGARPGAEPSRCRDDRRRGRPHGPPGRWPLLRAAGPFSYSVDAGTGGLRAGFRSGQIFGGKDPLWLETFRPQDTLFFFAFTSGLAGLAGNFFNTSVGGGVGAGVFGPSASPPAMPTEASCRRWAPRALPASWGSSRAPAAWTGAASSRCASTRACSPRRPGPERTGRSSAQNGPQDRFVSDTRTSPARPGTDRAFFGTKRSSGPFCVRHTHFTGPARDGPGVLRHKTVLRTVLCQTHALHRPGPGRTGRSSAQNGPQDRFVSSEPQAG